MKLSMNWLKSLVPHAYEPKTYIADMTMSGSKVETLDYLGAEIENVVVGRVTHMERHPTPTTSGFARSTLARGRISRSSPARKTSKRATWCPLRCTIRICRAAYTSKGKLRGLPSNGMLCSYKELGLTEHDVPGAYEDGILILGDTLTAEELAGLSRAAISARCWALTIGSLISRSRRTARTASP